jgi:hypothetical protein
MSGSQAPGTALIKLVGPDGVEGLRRFAAFATGPSTSTLTTKSRAIVKAVNTLRAVPEFQKAFSALFERDMFDSIDARDEARMARVLLNFIGYIGLEGFAEHAARQSKQHARGGLKAAEIRAASPSPYMKLLQEFELREGVTLTRNSSLALRQAAANWLRCRLSYVNELLKKRDLATRYTR